MTTRTKSSAHAPPALRRSELAEQLLRPFVLRAAGHHKSHIDQRGRPAVRSRGEGAPRDFRIRKRWPDCVPAGMRTTRQARRVVGYLDLGAKRGLVHRNRHLHTCMSSPTRSKSGMRFDSRLAVMIQVTRRTITPPGIPFRSGHTHARAVCDPRRDLRSCNRVLAARPPYPRPRHAAARPVGGADPNHRSASQRLREDHVPPLPSRLTHAAAVRALDVSGPRSDAGAYRQPSQVGRSTSRVTVTAGARYPLQRRLETQAQRHRRGGPLLRGRRERQGRRPDRAGRPRRAH